MSTIDPRSPQTVASSFELPVQEKSGVEKVLSHLDLLQPASAEELVSQLLPSDADAAVKSWLEGIFKTVETAQENFTTEMDTALQQISQTGEENHARVLAGAYRLARQSTEQGPAAELREKLGALVTEYPALSEMDYTHPLNTQHIPQVFIDGLKQEEIVPQVMAQKPKMSKNGTYLAVVAGIVVAAAVATFTAVKFGPVFLPRNVTSDTQTQPLKPTDLCNPATGRCGRISEEVNQLMLVKCDSFNTDFVSVTALHNKPKSVFKGTIHPQSFVNQFSIFDSISKVDMAPSAVDTLYGKTSVVCPENHFGNVSSKPELLPTAEVNTTQAGANNASKGPLSADDKTKILPAVKRTLDLHSLTEKNFFGTDNTCSRGLSDVFVSEGNKLVAKAQVYTNMASEWLQQGTTKIAGFAKKAMDYALVIDLPSQSLTRSTVGANSTVQAPCNVPGVTDTRLFEPEQEAPEQIGEPNLADDPAFLHATRGTRQRPTPAVKVTSENKNAELERLQKEAQKQELLSGFMNNRYKN